MKSLPKLLDDLWNNWAFRLSLASNEVFHSNILQFIAESLVRSVAPTTTPLSLVAVPADAPEIEPGVISVAASEQLLDLLAGSSLNISDALTTARKILADLNPMESLEVQREWKHLDLVVLLVKQGKPKRALFALEVKVKSYPTSKQLVDYRAVLNKSWEHSAQHKGFEPPLFLLTGMGSIPATDGLAVASFNFSDLAGRLKRLGGAAMQGPVQKEYVNLCELLHRLFEVLQRQLDPGLTWERSEAIGLMLYPYKLHAIWWKLWASYVSDECEAAIEAHRPACTLDLFHKHSGYTRTGSLELCWRWFDGTDALKATQLISLGVQIEKDSLRLFINIQHPELKDKSKARQNVEVVFLKLVAEQGLFANNPHFQQLLAQWKAKPESDTNFGNATFLKLFVDAPTKEIQDVFHNIFKLKSKASPRSDSFKPLLTGYSNGDDNGHADIRLIIKPTASVAAVSDAVRQILVDDAYSRRSSSPQHNPMMRQVVEGFRDTPDREGWLIAPTLGKPISNDIPPSSPSREYAEPV